MDAVNVNFAKALDKVSHKLLLAKLQKFRIRGDLLCVLNVNSRYHVIKEILNYLHQLFLYGSTPTK